MKYQLRIYDLLINNQDAILEFLKVLDVKDAKDKIKSILDQQLFEIIECNDSEILKIKKKSTGEIFEKGCKFYVKKYKVWCENAYLGNDLMGIYNGDSFYKNYVRSGYGGGLYHLNDISLTDIEEENIPKEEIVLDGVTYVKK
jgi:hypothetical protein